MDESVATVDILDDIRNLPAPEWDAFVPDNHPFLRYAFLASLEESGAVSADTGWQPYHLILRRNGQLLGVAPMYLKSHSFGEYVVDHGWANAYERAGGAYYPKLQI
jgi:predicted N-acyltransferase